MASLDHLSDGRFLFGVGGGWNLEEMRNHGTDPSRRFGLMRERIEAMKAIWTEDEAAYHGRRVDFDPIWSWPKPVQKPHPPVLVGGMGKGVLDRVLAYGDAWMPNRFDDVERLAGRMEKLQRRAEEAGRGRVPVTLFGAPPDAAVIERLERAGGDRTVFWVTPAGAADVERELDSFAGLAANYG